MRHRAFALTAWLTLTKLALVAGLAAQTDPALAPADQVLVRVLDLEEFQDKPVKIDSTGYLNLPIVGRIAAAGLTVEDLQKVIAGRLRAYLNAPSVTVTVSELHEEPVTVAGAVNSPGIKQIHGNKTLLEVLAEAGGVRPDAGPAVIITRAKDAGTIPLPGVHLDPSGAYYVAEIGIASLLHAQNPVENIPVYSHDIVAVPAAEMVYVLGEVARPGGYEMTTARVSVLNAIASAGGTNRNASSSHARILRSTPGSAGRTEYNVNINRMLSGKEKEFNLQSLDILYIPTNKTKVISARALEAMIGTGSSIAVFRSGR